MMSSLQAIIGAIGGILTVLGVCRYVPIFKCLTWCKIKRVKARYALEELYQMCNFKYTGGHRGERAINIDTREYTLKQLEKIYKNSTPFGCNSFNQPEWLHSARNLLQNEIADRQLLDQYE